MDSVDLDSVGTMRIYPDFSERVLNFHTSEKINKTFFYQDIEPCIEIRYQLWIRWYAR